MEIKIENLTKAYGDFKAVDNMNLNIADGELVGLLGPSGCGKSTTLFMLAGLNDPTSGHIYFGGKDVTKVAPEDREIGLVFHSSQLLVAGKEMLSYPYALIYNSRFGVPSTAAE